MKLTFNDLFFTVIKILINTEDYVTVDSMVDSLNVSKRKLYYVINDINSVLTSAYCKKIKTEYGKGIKITGEQKKVLSNYYNASKNEEALVLNQIERCSVIFSSIYVSNTKYNVNDFEELFDVSRFTIINDMNYLKEMIRAFNLEIVYNNKLGYLIVGKEYNKRKAYFYLFSNISELISENRFYIHFKEEVQRYSDIYNKLMEFTSTSGLYFDTPLMTISFVLTTYLYKKEGIDQGDVDDLLPDSDIKNELEIFEKAFPTLPLTEKRWLATYLSCSLINRNEANNDLSHSLNLVRKMNDIFYLYTSVKIDNEEFIASVARHIKTAFLRYKYGIYINNPLLKEIKNKYSSFFNVVKKIVQVLEQEIGVPINDSEIGFITLYYAGYVIKSNKGTPVIKTLIICACGLSTSYLLQNEIENIDPRISVLDCISADEYRNKNYDADLIISTIDLDAKNDNVIYVGSIIDDSDKVNVIGTINKILDNRNFDDEINLIDKYEIGVEDKVTKVFKPSYVRLIDNNEQDYRQLISIACKPLVDAGMIGNDYSNYIIENIEKYGFYMVYRNGYLLGHASIDHAKKLGLAFSKLVTPIYVNDTEISKIFIITPTNKFDHRFLLHGIGSILNSDELNSLIEEANSTEEIYNIILSVLSVY